MHGGAAELVDDDVGVLLRDQDVAGAAVQLQRNLIRHRRRRQEDRALLPEQVGDTRLQLVDGRVLPHLLVADLRGGDGSAHARRRAGDGVGAKIDHGPSPFCTRPGGAGTFDAVIVIGVDGSTGGQGGACATGCMRRRSEGRA